MSELKYDDVAVVTTRTLPGYEIINTFGEIFGLIVHGRDLNERNPVKCYPYWCVQR